MAEPARHDDDAPSLDELGDALGAAMTVLRSNAMAAGLDAAVPTCPGWSVRDLVMHQGMVHRWATQVVVGGGTGGAQRFLAGAAASPDLLGWYDEGATALLQAFSDAPPDLAAPTFLAEPADPLRFWVRRQCHETTIHAVDAMAARLGRVPAANETWVERRTALDGIDELLTGFVPSERYGVHTPEPRVWLVAPDDAPIAWRVRTSPDTAASTTRVGPVAEGTHADDVLAGDARALYLRLWNRAAPQPVKPPWFTRPGTGRLDPCLPWTT